MSFTDFCSNNRQIQWERFCDLIWFHNDLGIWLDVSRMRINAEDLAKLQPRFSKAFQAMQALEEGGIANQDEHRQVGHYWLRSPQLAPDSDTRDLIANEVDQIERFGSEIRTGSIKAPNGENFTDVLWIGIGGSGLGPLLMIRSLQQYGDRLKFHFLDNVDPLGISEVFGTLGDSLHTTLFVTVSKSGSTPEPRLVMKQARKRLEMIGGTWADQAIAVTMRGSQLDAQAQGEGWLNRFDMPDWVGGRTSITGAVGLLPGSLIGVNIREFLDGAAQMDEATRSPHLRQNPAALMASAWFLAGRGAGLRDMVVIPYKDRLEVFSRYLQQLIMESLGKRYDRQGNVVHQGLSVYGNKGSTDQHAYVQQLRDGLDNFFVTFIEVLENPDDLPLIDNERPRDYLSGFLQGTRAALTDSERQSLSISLRRFDARCLGALIALFERTVGLYGEIVDINSYHQPGVEAGKKAASRILDLQSQVESLMVDGVSRDISEIQMNLGTNSAEDIFWILRYLCSNDNSYIAQGDWAKPASMRFSKLKAR